MADENTPRPLKYFLPFISPYRPIEVTCPSCQTETHYFSHARMRTDERVHYLWTYQCQSCGTLTNSEEANPDGIPVALRLKCDCGGQFRRDKNIFCPTCAYRKTDENKASNTLYFTDDEMMELERRHGTEEM